LFAQEDQLKNVAVLSEQRFSEFSTVLMPYINIYLDQEDQLKNVAVLSGIFFFSIFSPI
jgi:hypothetical protein